MGNTSDEESEEHNRWIVQSKETQRSRVGGRQVDTGLGEGAGSSYR